MSTADTPTECDPPRLAAELRVAMSRLNRRMRAERPAAGLSDGQYSTMVTLFSSGEMTLRELAAQNHMKPPSMTKIVQALQDKGMVHRKAHPSDGRTSLVSLTALGESEVQETRQARLAWLGNQLQTLPVADRQVLAQAAKILSTLERS